MISVPKTFVTTLPDSPKDVILIASYVHPMFVLSPSYVDSISILSPFYLRSISVLSSKAGENRRKQANSSMNAKRRKKCGLWRTDMHHRDDAAYTKNVSCRLEPAGPISRRCRVGREKRVPPGSSKKWWDSRCSAHPTCCQERKKKSCRLKPGLQRPIPNPSVNAPKSPRLPGWNTSVKERKMISGNMLRRGPHHAPRVAFCAAVRAMPGAWRARGLVLTAHPRRSMFPLSAANHKATRRRKEAKSVQFWESL